MTELWTPDDHDERGPEREHYPWWLSLLLAFATVIWIALAVAVARWLT